jgi:hypothetical protein
VKKLRRLKAIDKAAGNLAVADSRGKQADVNALVRQLFGLVQELRAETAEEHQLNLDAASLMLCIKSDLPAPLRFYQAWGGYQYVRKLALKDGVLDWASIGAVKQGKAILIRPSDWAKLIQSKYPNFKYPSHV